MYINKNNCISSLPLFGSEDGAASEVRANNSASKSESLSDKPPLIESMLFRSGMSIKPNWKKKIGAH